MSAQDLESPTKNRAEQRRRQVDARRERLAAQLIDAPSSEVATRPALSTIAQNLSQALPRDLIGQGRIVFEPGAQPRVALYDPRLLAPNPQRARVIDRDLEELAKSLESHGQQEPIVARLITETDRKRWDGRFDADQILMILKGHRLHKACSLVGLRFLRVELMLPEDGEDDVAYGRRALRRASINMMQSQAYDIFDKVNLYDIWRGEFAITAPKDQEIVSYFEISRTEAQRVKTVAKLDPQVVRLILESDRQPADEVIFHIANRPQDEHYAAYKRFGHMTVASVRRLAQQENQQVELKSGMVADAGRPRNYVMRITSQTSPIAYLATNLTPRQWKDLGGETAFQQALHDLADNAEFVQRLQAELGNPSQDEDAKRGARRRASGV